MSFDDSVINSVEQDLHKIVSHLYGIEVLGSALKREPDTCLLPAPMEVQVSILSSCSCRGTALAMAHGVRH